jgi:hypothetical protein
MIQSHFQKPPLGAKLNFGHPLAAGLRGCWLFNEMAGNKVLDSSGNGIHGTFSNMGAPAAANSGWSLGPYGGGLIFDGSNDTVDLGASVPFLNITTYITISAWIYLPVSGAVGGHIFGNNGNLAYRFRIVSGSPASLNFLDRGATNQIASTSQLVLGQHYHVGVTGSPQGLKLYINGRLDISNAVAFGGGTGGQCNIGSISTYGEFLNGFIDNLYIYNRCLSAPEVAMLYNNPFIMFAQKEQYEVTAAGWPIKLSPDEMMSVATMDQPKWKSGNYRMFLTF